jgi:hypothetical protein
MRSLIMAPATMCLLVAGCADVVLGARVDDTGMALRRHPGASAAAAYAEALHQAIEAHAYRGDSPDFQRRANEALTALSNSEAVAGPDRPRLVAWRGLLLLDLGRTDQGRAELDRSMAMRPTLVAARGIVSILHRQGRPGDVGQTCASSAAATTERDELFRLMEMCAANRKAPDDATGLSWATPEMRAFYDAERARRRWEAEEEEAAEAMALSRGMDDQIAAQAAAQDAAQAAAREALQAAQPPTAPMPPAP